MIQRFNISKIRINIILLSLCAIVTNIAYSAVANALTGSDLAACVASIGGRSNSAIQRVCSEYHTRDMDQRKGAEWINGSSSFSASTTVDVKETTGTMTIYMHRAVYGGQLGADSINVVKRPLSDYVSRSFNSASLGVVNWISGFGGYLGSGSGGDGRWSSGGTISGTLDIDKFIEETGCNTECDIQVYIYRCSARGEVSTAEPCTTDPSTIHFEIGGTTPPPETPPTASICEKLKTDLGGYSAATDLWGLTQALSGVIKNTGTTWEHIVYVKPNDYVKFAHCYFPDAHTVKVTSKVPGDGDHQKHRPETHCPCSENCGEDRDSCCCDKSTDYYTRDSSRNYYLANDDYFEVKASPESYKFKQQVVGANNNSFRYDANAGYAYGAFGYKATTSRDTNPVAIVSPELNSNEYNCGTSPLGAYTIVGTDPRNCTNGINGGMWDPGTTFEQYVYYRGTIETQAKVYHEDCPYGSSPAHPGKLHRDGYYVEDFTRDGDDESHKRAQVVVPYNFDTEIKVSMNTDPVVYPGASITSTVSGAILPKNNVDVGSTYATITPSESKVEVAEFTLPAWMNPGDLSGDSNTGLDPYSYAASIGGQDIQTRRIGNGPFNKRSSSYADLSEWLDSGGEVRSVVPDVDTGTKLCTLVGISPSDSHNLPDQGVPSGGNGVGSGRGQNEFGQWRISGVTCRTIAKKPTFQVWSSGIYSGSSIQTFITDKCLRSGVMIVIGRECDRTVYGSWSEYEAIALGAITNFASASGYGFSSTPSSHGDGGRDGGIPRTSYRDAYNYSHATISNDADYLKGLSNISVDDAFLARIMSRYNTTTSGYDGCNIGGLAEWQVRNAPGHVIVLRCNGTATINGNIITGHDRYYKIDDLPQVIIIANNINISSDVTELDAWLIATSNTNSANGTINTCHQFRAGSTASSADKWSAGSSVCSRQLTVNGPVITGRIYLNRSYGAFPAENSIEPAEVFNLRADAYLWAYSQSEDYHQAVTTYTRELAPRY